MTYKVSDPQGLKRRCPACGLFGHTGRDCPKMKGLGHTWLNNRWWHFDREGKFVPVEIERAK